MANSGTTRARSGQAQRTGRPERTERALGAGAGAAALVALVLGLAVAPPDALQGQPQRLMYVHVPAAWTAYAAFAVVLAAGAAHLLGRPPFWDRLARAAAELGAGMTALALALGVLWGRPVWGVWWTWDPRIVSTAAMLLVYLACLGVRAWPADPRAGARAAAVTGIAGFGVVPVVHFSVLWWPALHQPPSVLRPAGAVPVDPPMLAALAVGVVAFLLAGAWVVTRRVRALDVRPTVPVRVPAGAPAHHGERVPAGSAW
ncbi:cytochrome c biogenesis protein CcsA [Nonomuraea pusilla]|uniref:Heme exporter protein C n=1 Tax=Nonomuraea pusilla TaxID=46177 RepID=A0A1H7I376_9ACTN|nr:cytochrome c biogenesis protein CcsA [Nonomuraea pusilla]SEK55890.1 heme exporter protein C [Nonomuraea pusilla]